MTERQALFCEYYLRYRNGKKAAIAAGYREKSASVCAGRLLKLPEIQERIQGEREATLHKPVAGDQEILEYPTAVMRGEVEESSSRERMKAAELLGRSTSLFTEGLKGDGGEVVVFYNESSLGD